MKYFTEEDLQNAIFQVITREAAKKLFFKGSAIKPLTPPPSSLIAAGTSPSEKSSFLMALPLKKKIKKSAASLRQLFFCGSL